MISIIPTLEVQYRLMAIPRGQERFEKYLEAMTDGTDNIVLPLGLFNPMGKEHVVETVETLIDMGAEKLAGETVTEALGRIDNADVSFQVALVVTDDLKGGWTNRYSTDYEHRFNAMRELKRGWATALFWTSEKQTAECVRERVLETVYRTLYVARHGEANSLSEKMRQEGFAALFASDESPNLDSEELAYTKEVISPYLDSEPQSSVFPCLYGDDAAIDFGYTPLGLSPFAGYDVALSEATASSLTPEAVVNDFISTKGTR